MSDQHFHEHTTRYEGNSTVTEVRAPTDESVKILRELELAAQAKIVSAIRVTDTSFECVVHRQYDAMNDQMRFRSMFSVGGQRMDVSVDRNCPINEEKVYEEIVEMMSQVIANQILMPAFVKSRRTS